MSAIGALFGKSMAFPPQLDGESRTAWSEGADNIRESIRIILSTEPGERLMLPTFGAGLRRFLFEPNTVTTHRRIEEAVRQSLVLWEGRIKVDEVSVEADPDDTQSALMTLRYTLVANQVGDQLLLRVQLES
jgi:phage baseplate assembly protein W